MDMFCKDLILKSSFTSADIPFMQADELWNHRALKEIHLSPWEMTQVYTIDSYSFSGYRQFSFFNDLVLRKAVHIVKDQAQRFQTLKPYS